MDTGSCSYTGTDDDRLCFIRIEFITQVRSVLPGIVIAYDGETSGHFAAGFKLFEAVSANALQALQPKILVYHRNQQIAFFVLPDAQLVHNVKIQPFFHQIGMIAVGKGGLFPLLGRLFLCKPLQNFALPFPLRFLCSQLCALLRHFFRRQALAAIVLPVFFVPGNEILDESGWFQAVQV